ncbi:MAG: ABC transporter ATP-binding protein [Candidatus Aminicenantes bacterium]|nr:MAG: ABC transporter ATP-binding protein [Candidatus Aminicenantes bacterium]
MEYIIVIKHLNFSYPDAHPVLTGINLEIKKGEIFGIIGPTGAGKSTLLQHLNGILKGDGEILVDDLKIEKKNEKKIREKVGIVFQNPDDQLFCPTVYEDIAFGLVNLGFTPGEIDKKITHILEKMNLSHLRDLSSHHLSYGEKKRVALATVLVMNPLVIALDEPFANLDYKSILNIIAMIKSLAITRIIISQDILLALSICDRIALLDKGKIVKVALPEEIAADYETLSKTGLDYQPYIDLIKRYIRT